MVFRPQGVLDRGGVIDELWSRRQALRQLGVVAAAGAAALPITAAAQEAHGWDGKPPPVPGQAPPDFLGFDLEASAPQTFSGGAIRTLTQTEMPALNGLSFFAVQFEEGGLGELHWHANANELGVQLAGQGEVGILSPDGTGTTTTIEPGGVTFVPRGYAHYFRNVGTEPMHRIACFTNAAPETYLLSSTLQPVPQAVLAAPFGLGPNEFPFLAARGTQFIVKVPGALPAVSEATPAAAATPNPYSVQSTAVEPTVFAGGAVREIGVKDIPALDGATVFPVQIEPYGMREPHWHTNAHELTYVMRGHAQFGIVAPDGGVQSFVIGPGGATFVPVNWFHYAANVGDEPLEMLAFYNNAQPSHLDLSQTFDFFPPEVLAASFALDPKVFADLPKKGDVVIAPAPPGIE
jgi:oxalate decarboxylase